MRSLVFRTDPIFLPGGGGAVTTFKSLDGVSAITLYLENVDLKAALQMRTGGTDVGDNTIATRAISFVTQRGGKNACLKFENVVAGATAAVQTVAMTCGVADQAFAIVDLGSDDYRIDLKCDSAGLPVQTALQILKAIEDEVSAGATAYRAAINTTLAPGSDGSARPLPLDGSTTRVIADATALLGGTDSFATGTTTVAVSPVEPSTNGPWINHTTEGTALSTVAADSAASVLLLDTPNGFLTIAAKGLRVVVTPAATGTWIVLSGYTTRL